MVGEEIGRNKQICGAWTMVFFFEILKVVHSKSDHDINAEVVYYYSDVTIALR